jgi:hypothetical protein
VEDITVSNDGRNSTVTVAPTNDVIVTPTQDATVISVGIQGPAGPQGIPGSGGDKTFTQAFASVSSVTVTHNLGKYPAVSVLDSAGDECEGDVDHLSVNQFTVTFSAPFSGSVICN